MGQDTYVDTGVSVQLRFTFENRKHIYYLLQECLVESYVQHKKDYDEIYSIEYEYNFNEKENEENEENEENDNHYGFSLPSASFLKKVSMMDDEKEFEERLDKSNNYSQLTFIFLYPFLNAHARNMSRREHAHIFEQLYNTPDNLVQTIQEGQEFFLKIGVPQKLIRIGYSFRDST